MLATAISFDLIMRVRELYTMAYQEISSNKRRRKLPDNGITDYAIPAYILSVASIEAFMNEYFLAVGKDFLKDSSFSKLSPEEIQLFQKANLGDKLIKLPALAFDQKVFDRGCQPFQDMSYLINIRDSFVHYKMGFEAEYKSAFEYLTRKGIAINSPEGSSKSWVSDLSTFQGIRWAHNTTLMVIKEIIDTAIKLNRHQLLISIGTKIPNFFDQIPNPDNKELWLAWMNSHYRWKIVVKQEAG